MSSDTHTAAPPSLMQHPRAPVPLTILTGFLGAGKTTVLNTILHADHGLNVAVMVNDFGSINIDTRLIVGVEGETISLANGCICCTMRDDLLMAALRLMTNPNPPEYLLIEASGVSDPWAVAETFLLPELRPLFQLDGIITVVDTEQVRQPIDYADLIVDQITAADIVILNKIDLVSPADLATVSDWVRTIVPRARILTAVHGVVPLPFILGVGRYRIPLEAVSVGAPPPQQTLMDEHADHTHDGHDHTHNHQAVFETWSYHAERPFGLRAFQQVIQNLPMTIFRAKGVIWIAESPGRGAVVQMVGSRIMLTIGKPWDDTPPHTALVMIGTPGGIDGDTLTRQFDACLRDVPAAEDLPAEQQWVRES